MKAITTIAIDPTVLGLMKEKFPRQLSSHIEQLLRVELELPDTGDRKDPEEKKKLIQARIKVLQTSLESEKHNLEKVDQQEKDDGITTVRL